VHALKLVFESVFDPRELEALHHHVALDLLDLGSRGACHLLMDATIKLKFLQGALQPFGDDLREALVGHGV